MQVFDASSVIHAWDNYPVRQFPPLWKWIARQIEQRRLVMPRVAFEEVWDKMPDCGHWLRENEIQQYEVNNELLQDAMRIKDLLGIIDDKYHPNGVGETDLFIIVTARALEAELVSEEHQPNPPNLPSRRKIPTVCAMTEVAVPCINFIKYIKRSDEVFG